MVSSSSNNQESIKPARPDPTPPRTQSPFIQTQSLYSNYFFCYLLLHLSSSTDVYTASSFTDNFCTTALQLFCYHIYPAPHMYSSSSTCRHSLYDILFFCYLLRYQYFICSAAQMYIQLLHLQYLCSLYVTTILLSADIIYLQTFSLRQLFHAILLSLFSSSTVMYAAPPSEDSLRYTVFSKYRY